MSERQHLSEPIVTRAASRPLAWRGVARLVVGDVLLLIGLVVLVVPGLGLSYRTPVSYTLPIDRVDGLDKSGLGELEHGDSGWFRWSAPDMLIRFPGIGQANTDVRITFHSPQMPSPRTITVGTDRATLGSYTLRSGWQHIAVAVPNDAIERATGDLNLRVRVDPPFDAGNRSLGVAISNLEISQRGAAPAPLATQTALMWLAVLLVVPLRVLGAPPRWVGVGVGGLLVLAIALLAQWRIDLLLSVVPIIDVIVISLLALPLLLWWIKSQNAAARPWATGVAIGALAMFVARLAGMQHPQFVLIDHVLRVHQIEGIAAGQREAVQAALSQQYEWGRDVAVPYSLLAYDLFVPLASRLSTTQLLLMVEGVTAALDATVPLFLWDIVRRNGFDAPTRWWSAILFGVMPVGYLYFHDGSYPTIIGLWITVVALWVITGAAGWRLEARGQGSGIGDRESETAGLGVRGWRLGVGERGAKRDPQYAILNTQYSSFSIPRFSVLGSCIFAAAMIALSILMYVTHLAFVPALGGAMVGSMLLFGVGPVRRYARTMAIIGVAGVLIAFLGYYGAQLPELLGNTIPAYLRTLGSGGSVGRDAALLPGPLLGNAWQQLWGHYRIVVVALAAVGVLLSLRDRSRPLTHLLVAYGIFLILTTFADTRFGLWNKHMYFALPGVCLAAAIVLGELHRRAFAGRILAWTLFGFLVWTSLEAWALRVIWYVWSLNTL
jgi:hypothetical protein